MRSLALAVLCAGACGGVKQDAGLGASMRVAGAQLVAGDLMRAGPAGGPDVLSIIDSRPLVLPGEIDKPLRGTLAATATAAAVGLAGDDGYWIVLAGVPDLDAPGLPTFSAVVSFAATLPPGPAQILVRAVDATGRFGPATGSPVTVLGPQAASAALLFSLRWDTEADLDLHVIDPQGIEVWAGNINSYTPPPPGQQADADAWQAGGQLDFDSNAGCVIDGRRQEDVQWTNAAPAGRYVVRVETPSLCGQATARWTVEAYAAGVLLGRAQGQSTDSDERFATGAGGGVTALTVDVAR